MFSNILGHFRDNIKHDLFLTTFLILANPLGTVFMDPYFILHRFTVGSTIDVPGSTSSHNPAICPTQLMESMPKS